MTLLQVLTRRWPATFVPTRRITNVTVNAPHNLADEAAVVVDVDWDESAGPPKHRKYTFSVRLDG